VNSHVHARTAHDEATRRLPPRKTPLAPMGKKGIQLDGRQCNSATMTMKATTETFNTVMQLVARLDSLTPCSSSKTVAMDINMASGLKA
jgi:hypothetical protein